MALDRLTQITSSGISSTSTITVSAIAGSITGVVTATSLSVTGSVTTGLDVSGIVTATTFSGNVTGTAVTATTANFTNATISGDLTVQGTTTTLDTTLTEVDKLEVGANNTTVGVAITQSGTGDILRLYDSATQVVTVKDGGKVGINKENPSAALSAYHATNNTIGIFESGDSVARVTFLDPGGQAHVGNEGDDLVLSVTSVASEALRIDSSGRVAIGTDTPVSGKRLTVDGDNATGVRVDGNTQGGAIEFSTAGTLTAAVGNQGNILSNSDSGLLLYTATGNTTRFYTGGTETLRINSNGNVGIGTAIPSSDYRVTIKSTTSPHSALLLDTTESDYNTNLYFARQGINKWIIGNKYSDDAFRFVAGSTEVARITSSGSVGIGTDNPGEPLTVQGATDQGLLIQSYDTTSGAQNTGPYIYGNFWDGTAARSAGSIAFLKENGTSGNYASYMAFRTRANGGSPQERLRIDSSGRVKMPYQPAFSARQTQSAHSGAVDAEQVFDVVHVNVGGHYNSSNGRFTAPIDGTYFFYFQLLTNSTSARSIIYLTKNNSTAVPSIEGSADCEQYNNVRASGIFTLSAGDYVSVKNHPSTTYINLYNNPANQNWFIGYLIG